MALIRCPECSGQVSDQATTCPHCGYPLKGQTAAGLNPSVEERFRQIHAEKGAIQAIKYLRQTTGMGLAAAKAFYDQEKASGRLGAAPATAGPRGCLTLFVMAVPFVAALARSV